MKKLQTDLLAIYLERKDQFDRYAELLIRWNAKINLTAITDHRQIEELHFVDSLAVAAWLREENVSRETFRISDIGAGGGFPGIPIKIVQPEIELALIDAVKKKCDFMKEVVRSLSLNRIHVIHGRVDGEQNFGRFDMVVSRAAFKLKDLMLHARPNLSEKGVLVAMKSIDIREELDEALSKMNSLGFASLEQVSYLLPYSRQERQLVIVRR